MGKVLSISTVVGVTLSPIRKGTIDVTRAVTFREIILTTSAGPLMLRNLSFYVEKDNLSMEVIVGRPMMTLLGSSSDKLLVEARSVSPDWELEGSHSSVKKEGEAPKTTQTMRMLQVNPLRAIEDEEEKVERQETRTATPVMNPTNLAEVIHYVEKKVEVAAKMGLAMDGIAKLTAILRVRADNFRVEFGNDTPVSVAPMQVRLKQGAQTVRAQPRRYSPTGCDFLDRHTHTLIENSLIFKNHRRRGAPAPRIVRKKEQDIDPNADPRMTIDTRSVNEKTEPMPWSMPVLDVVIGELEGAKFFFVLDWFRGYWQLPLHPDSQEFYSFVTHQGIYTSTRVPMGATDAVAYCQGVVEEIFGGLLGECLLAWLDDILGYAQSEEALLEVLDKVLARCEQYGLKLHAKKYTFFATEVKWCGRIISSTASSTVRRESRD